MLDAGVPRGLAASFAGLLVHGAPVWPRRGGAWNEGEEGEHRDNPEPKDELAQRYGRLLSLNRPRRVEQTPGMASAPRSSRVGATFTSALRSPNESLRHLAVQFFRRHRASQTPADRPATLVGRSARPRRSDPRRGGQARPVGLAGRTCDGPIRARRRVVSIPSTWPVLELRPGNRG